MTTHKILNANSACLSSVPDASVDLVVTSPPYPMIEMWDDLFYNEDQSITRDLNYGRGLAAFTKMHEILNCVWKECDRVLKNNGFVCINIGDATRTLKCIPITHILLISFKPLAIVYCRIFIGENHQILQISLWVLGCILLVPM